MNRSLDRNRSLRLAYVLVVAAACGLCFAHDVAHADDVSSASPRFPLMTYAATDGARVPVRSAADWQRRRGEILNAFQLVAGPLPDEARRIPLDVRVLDEVRQPEFLRRKISLAVEPHDRVEAYLFLPTGAAAPRAAVLCLHQTNRFGKDEPAGLAGDPNLHYALELAKRGYVTLAVDYPRFGSYQVDPYALGYFSATMKGIWNHRRAVDYLISLAEVDPKHIGVIGHSLGGHNSIFAALFDERIACAVSNCGFTSFARYYDGDLHGWSHAGYMPRILERYACDPRRMPVEFTEIVASLAPRPFLAIAPLGDENFAVDGVADCIADGTRAYRLLDAEPRLAALYPDCAHQFPPEVRRQAYAWLDRWLKHRPTAEVP